LIKRFHGALMTVRTCNKFGRCSKRHSRRGATLVEFALTVPIFLLFLMAAFEFGWMNVLRHTADNAAYEAARTAMVPGATAAEAVAKATNLLSVVGARGASVTVTPSILTSATDQVTVDIAIPMNRNGLVVPRFAKGKSIRASSTLRTERAE
jgi:Flp pilus assembly protein TadG